MSKPWTDEAVAVRRIHLVVFPPSGSIRSKGRCRLLTPCSNRDDGSASSPGGNPLGRTSAQSQNRQRIDPGVSSAVPVAVAVRGVTS
jgi:hypothetical protein